MRYLTLRCGMQVKVDDQDYEWLSMWEWHLIRGQYAAQGQRRKSDGKYKKILMHIVIAKVAGFRFFKSCEVDHKNRDTLDNQRHNLQVGTKSDNQHNTKVRSDSTTGIRGVHVTPQGSFMARIQIDGKRVCLGRFDILKEAKDARLEAEKTRISATR